ncbi:MAG: zinc-binding dehydrogenase, partial [Gammaproteobacteria bacterium]|nr:zinc-binding dehydrogenase [Gammaproteobacteria bacterium]
GAGGVGSIAIQLARHRGAHVITTASARNHDYLAGLGADHAIDYTAGDELEQIRALAPEGVDLLFDCIGIETVNDLVPAVKAGGRVVTIAGVPDEATWRAQGLADGRRIVMRNEPEQLRQLGDLLAAGHLSATPVREYALADAPAAHEESAAGHVRGKLLLVPEHDD